MPKTRINCPNCRQPLIADVEQLFDVGQDPDYKQRLLSGYFNVVQCQNCGYQGSLAAPIVYHDPEKELLLTYFPPELSLPLNEQERIIGPLITRVTNSLPQEKRKAYLLRPQTMLTLQSLIEKVLEADGITKEMLQAQQQRLALLQRFMTASSDDVIQEIARQEDKLIDTEFFTLASRLMQAALAGGDQEAARQISDLQQKLLPITTVGRQLQIQSKEIESAIQSVKDLGPQMTREQLLDLVVKSESDMQLNVIASLTRPGMDYQFFQMLSERIDRARADGRTRLIALREKLLEMTRAIDQQVEVRMMNSRQLLNSVLQSANLEEAMAQRLPEVDEFFMKTLNDELAAARKQGDLMKISKLHEIEQFLQKASAPPPEIELIEEFVNAPSESALHSLMEQHKDEITPSFMEVLTSIVTRMSEGDDAELAKRIQVVYQIALRYSMRASMKS